MKAHIVYASYVLKHKWYVFLECLRMGLPLLGVLHDWSKFTLTEWFPYVHYFYYPDGEHRQIRDKTGYYKPEDTGDPAFDMAWLHHQKVNKHHWQYWVLPKDDGTFKAMEIPARYTMEMVADWCGAARAQGKLKESVLEWYDKNKAKMILHTSTRCFVEYLLEWCIRNDKTSTSCNS